MMKFIFLPFLLTFLIFFLFFFWASYPWSLHEKKISPEIYSLWIDPSVNIEENPSVLKILTYNLSFLYGKGSEGPLYEKRGKEFYEEQLKKISEEIKKWEADIVCLQEVDFSGDRSHDLNQAHFIAKISNYPFVAEVPSWVSNYIPFPYWPIKNHFGRINSGGAILSKYPLSLHEVTLFSKPASKPWWYNLFYLHRYVQKVTVTVGDQTFNIFNVHLEAFDKTDRQKQIKLLLSRIQKKNLHFMAGDFNMVPTIATKKSKFFNEDNYEFDTSFEDMKTSGFLEVIPEEIYQKDESLYFTFPAWAPDRRLDYIWYKKDLKMMKAEVLPSALSDHLPLKASFQISGPNFNPYSQ
jgi:endonuclease/exonuclease/phosphatase family metal-dependent hydrolase